MCECKICQRSREFRKHLKTIENVEAKNFFRETFEYLYEIEEELSFHEIYLNNVKTKYPDIYKKIKKLGPI
jgi:hypothetical protein